MDDLAVVEENLRLVDLLKKKDAELKHKDKLLRSKDRMINSLKQSTSDLKANALKMKEEMKAMAKRSQPQHDGPRRPKPYGHGEERKGPYKGPYKGPEKEDYEKRALVQKWELQSKKIHALGQENGELRVENKNLKHKNCALDGTVETLQKLIYDKEQEISSLIVENEASKHKIEQKREKILKMKKNASVEDSRSLEQTIQSLNDTLCDQKALIEMYEAAVEELKLKKKHSKKEMKKAQKKLQEMEENEEEIRKLRDLVEDKEEEVEYLKEKLAKQKEKHKSFKKEMAKEEDKKEEQTHGRNDNSTNSEVAKLKLKISMLEKLNSNSLPSTLQPSPCMEILSFQITSIRSLLICPLTK